MGQTKAAFRSGNLFFRDTTLSPAVGGINKLWEDCPYLAAQNDPTIGYGFFDHFFGFDDTSTTWIKTAATSGTATAGVLAGGTVALSAGAATSHQGIQIQRAGSAFKPAAGKDIWFECRLKVSTLVLESFLGLAVLDTTLVASGAPAVSDHISISSVTGDGVLLPRTGSSSSETAGTTIGTLVAATYIRLGFKVSGVTSVTPYVNGVAQTAITGTIPTVALTPSFVCQAAGTGTPITDLDWVRCFQLA